MKKHADAFKGEKFRMEDEVLDKVKPVLLKRLCACSEECLKLVKPLAPRNVVPKNVG